MLEDRVVFIDGEFIAWENASVHIMSHSFGRGSAIFEVISCHDTDSGPAIFRLPEHIERLFKSAELLEMEQHIVETRSHNGGKNHPEADIGNDLWIKPPLLRTPGRKPDAEEKRECEHETVTVDGKFKDFEEYGMHSDLSLVLRDACRSVAYAPENSFCQGGNGSGASEHSALQRIRTYVSHHLLLPTISCILRMTSSTPSPVTADIKYHPFGWVNRPGFPIRSFFVKIHRRGFSTSAPL